MISNLVVSEGLLAAAVRQPETSERYMNNYDWSSVRAGAIERFRGELPRPETEEAILRVFEVWPTIVVSAIDRIAEALIRGQVRSGWAVLRSDVERAAEPCRNVSVGGPDRESVLRRAEDCVRNAGVHFASESEVVDELFGSRGMLRAYPDMRERISSLWRELRPLGEQVEREEIDRAARWKAIRAKTRRTPKSETRG